MFLMFSFAFWLQRYLTQKPKPVLPISCFSNSSMYPKVKVREQEEDDDLLTVYDHDKAIHLSVWECEDDSPPSIVRIPKSYIANSAIRMIPLPKGEGKSSNKKKAMEDSRPNIRSSPIPRPRAVLSSPVNDGVIGGRNKAKIEVLSGLKDHNLRQTRHTQCNVIPGRSTVETPITTKRESKEAADGKTDLEQKKGSAKANPRQRADLRKGKFDSV